MLQHNQPVELSSLTDSGSPDLVLVNPAAGAGRARAVLPELTKFANQRGWHSEICVTGSPEDLIAKARLAAAAGTERIFVLGGDGTLQLLVNALTAYPETILGVIPAGGGNDVAASLGLPPDPIEAATLLLNGKICCLDAARVRTSDGKERLYVGGGGVGLDSEAARYANGPYRNLHGRLRYVLAAIRALFGFHAFRVRVVASASEPKNLEATALVVGVLNTPSYGAGVRLAPDAKIDDGKLDIVLVEDLSLVQILALLPAFVARGRLNTPHVQRFTADCVRIETDSPRWFHADGELLGMTPVEICVVPKAIRVLRPARKRNS